jgi:hypothetical protein
LKNSDPENLEVKKRADSQSHGQLDATLKNSHRKLPSAGKGEQEQSCVSQRFGKHCSRDVREDDEKKCSSCPQKRTPEEVACWKYEKESKTVVKIFVRKSFRETSQRFECPEDTLNQRYSRGRVALELRDSFPAPH